MPSILTSSAKATTQPVTTNVRRVARVAVVRTLSEAEGVWRDLARSAPISPYQNFDWTAAWIATVGRASAVEPAIVIIHDESEHVLGLLPLGITVRRGLRTAVFLGGSDSNGNMGLFAPNADWSAAALVTVLRQAAAEASIDLFSLINQRTTWKGVRNPIHALGGRPSPSASHAVDLSPDPDRFLAKRLTKHARKHLRSKRARLEALGVVRHERARTRLEVQALLDCQAAQQSARFRWLGIRERTDAEALRAFLDIASDPNARSGALIEVHALLCGDRVVATFSGTGDSRRFSGLMISHDPSDAVAACSPGDLLLAEVIADKCRRGTESFDLGIGEARYKSRFCPDVEPLFDIHLGFTVKGRIAAAIRTQAAALKALLKGSPRLWPLLQRMRRAIRGTAAAPLHRIHGHTSTERGRYPSPATGKVSPEG